MERLPILSGEKIIRLFEKIGYREIRQRGSHIRLENENRPPITVPDYSTVGRGLLRKILRDAKISPEEFSKLLK